MKWKNLLLTLCLAITTSSLFANFKPIKWAVYYSDKAKLSEFQPFHLLVLDSQYHPPLRPLSERNKMLLGYISLGEAESNRGYFADVKQEGILLQENPYWKGSYYVDVRDRRWAKRVIEELIPNILIQGFDGLFFDTLDNPAELERQDPVKYKGMTQAAVDLVKLIRENYPDIPIMMNRGYELLPQVAPYITMELGESIYADYNFKEKKYQFVPSNLYQQQVRILQKAKKNHPSLQIYTLDYWYPEDKTTIKKIYEEEMSNGFSPYVATVELDKIVPM